MPVLSRMLRTLIFIFLMSVVLSCKDNYIDENRVVFRLDTTSSSVIKISSFIDSVFVFQPSEEALISRVDDVLFFDQYVYIVDRTQQRQIHIYNSNGSFIQTLSSGGGGPGHFRSPGRIRINNCGDKLIVYCPLNKKFLRYSLEGEFQDEFILNEIGLVGDFIESDDKVIFYNVMADRSINRVGIFSWSDFPDPLIEYIQINDKPIKVKSSKSRYFYQIPDSNDIYFKDYLSNSLVKINIDSRLEVINFNGFDLTIFDSNKFYELQELSSVFESQGLKTIGYSLVVSSKFIIFPIIQHNQSIGSFVIDFEKNSVVFIDKFVDDLTGLFTFSSFSASYNSSSGYAFQVVSPDFIKYRMEDGFNFPNSNLERDLRKIDSKINQNPVFIGYRLKDN